MPFFRKSLPACLLLLVALLVPLLGDDYLQRLAVRALCFGLLALSLDLLVGQGGLISLGHAAPFGLGAYATVLLGLAGITGLPAVLAICLLLGLGMGLAVGALALRARGLAFIFLTLASSEILFYLVRGLRGLGGFDGLALRQRDWLPLLGSLRQTGPLYAGALLLVILVAAGLYGLSRTHLFRRIRAVRDEERRAASLGLSPLRHRLALFAAAYPIAAMAGCLYANLNGFVGPELLSWQFSGELLAMVILGGSGTLIGPLLGGIAFVGFEAWLSTLTDHWLFWFGLLMLVRVLAGSAIAGGLRGGLQSLAARRRRHVRGVVS